MTGQLLPLTQFAQGHHGLFRTSDATALGFPEDQLRRLRAAGWIDRPARGIYRMAGSPPTREQQILGAVWAAHADAVAALRSAGYLLGLARFPGAGPEVLAPFGISQRLELGTLHVSKVIPESHRRTVDGIPTTSVARTLFDLAGVLPDEFAGSLLDAALANRRCTLDQVQQVFFALARRGRRGTATMRALLEARGAGYVPPASELERRARALFRQANLPVPAFEVDLGDEAWIGRVDCVWRPQRVIVELDGRRYHDGRTRLEADRQRDNRLAAQGWRIIRVTWEDLQHRPMEVVAWIRRALQSAAA